MRPLYNQPLFITFTNELNLYITALNSKGAPNPSYLGVIGDSRGWRGKDGFEDCQRIRIDSSWHPMWVVDLGASTFPLLFWWSLF